MIQGKEQNIEKQQAIIHSFGEKSNALTLEMVTICSNPNDMNMERIEEINREKEEMQNQKQTIGKSIKNLKASKQGISLLIGEIINEEAIDCNLWIQLSSNKSDTNSDKTAKRAIKTK